MNEIPTPALLSPDRQAEIDGTLAELKAGTTLVRLPAYYQQDVPALLADRTAFRQQVADELHRMLIKMSGPIVRDGVAWPLSTEEKEWVRHNEHIHDAAARLGLQLPT